MDLLSALILSGCAASQADPQETFAESSADASSEEIITLESAAAEETEPPVIDETFSDEDFSTEKRGTVIHGTASGITPTSSVEMSLKLRALSEAQIQTSKFLFLTA